MYKNEYQSHFFYNIEYVPNEGHMTRRTFDINCDSRRWFHSPDGGSSHTRLDTKHTIDNNNLQLDFSNASGSDEGIYGCLSRQDNWICVQVHGESCPWPSLFLVTTCGYYCHIIIMFVV